MSYYGFQPSDEAICKRLDTIIKQQAEIIALLREQTGKLPKKAALQEFDMDDGRRMVYQPEDRETIVITEAEIHDAIDRMQREGRL